MYRQNYNLSRHNEVRGLIRLPFVKSTRHFALSATYESSYPKSRYNEVHGLTRKVTIYSSELG